MNPKDKQPKSEKKIGKAKTGVQGMSDVKTPKDIVVRQDPEHFITCMVIDPVKSYNITFDPALLDKKREKYGERLVVPGHLLNSLLG